MAAKAQAGEEEDLEDNKTMAEMTAHMAAKAAKMAAKMAAK